jgi:hypothetical protein
MTTAMHHPPGDLIEWLDLEPLAERLRRGEVWAPAPTQPGRGRAYWVMPFGERACVLVIATSSRHRAGALLCDGRYWPKGGRWIDKGEHYRETFAPPLAAPRRPVRIPAFANPSQQELIDTEWFYGLCERAARGE